MKKRSANALFLDFKSKPYNSYILGGDTINNSYYKKAECVDAYAHSDESQEGHL